MRWTNTVFMFAYYIVQNWGRFTSQVLRNIIHEMYLHIVPKVWDNFLKWTNNCITAPQFSGILRSKMWAYNFKKKWRGLILLSSILTKLTNYSMLDKVKL